jgi:predicted transcriptional regulator
MTGQKLSRLELYVEILKAVCNQPYSNFKELLEKTHMDKEAMVYAVSFLEKQNLIKSEIVKNETVYVSTPRGLLVTRFFANRIQIAPQEDLFCDTSGS